MPRLALLQSRAFPTKTEAFEHHESLIRQAAAKGANIVVTQELFLTPYFCTIEDPALFDLADPLPGPTGMSFAFAHLMKSDTMRK